MMKAALFSVADRLYLAILHEDGHSKFKGHRRNQNDHGRRSDVFMSSENSISHVYDDGGIMNDDKIGDFYDDEMIRRLQKRHGKITED